MESRLPVYEERLVSLWDRLVRLLGIHTVNVLMERAIFETAQRHAEVAQIQHTDGGLQFAALERVYRDRPYEEVEQAFGDLSSNMLMILARLLGKQIAQQLAQDLTGPEPLAGGLGAQEEA
jgi:hypothetical protein